jgi:predicted phosphohydrolase
MRRSRPEELAVSFILLDGREQMSLYAIGDLHLSLGTDKPMDVFGREWENYVEKIIEGFKDISEDDVCVICGDISWGMNLKEAEEDFLFISRLPGKKIILKGNHDYWWSTAKKAYSFFDEKGINNIEILHNNCFFYGDVAICGTRGWFYEEEKDSEHDRKIVLRELGRLETSLKAAGDKEKLVFLHYPPKYGDYECGEILDLLNKYKVSLCCYGHIHSKGRQMAFEGYYRGVRHVLVSADHLRFRPYHIKY